LCLQYRLEEPKVKEQGLTSQGSTEEQAMTAINWLATQLAWEQRLVELRADERPAKLQERLQVRTADKTPKAA
jgi:hypothetical protein